MKQALILTLLFQFLAVSAQDIRVYSQEDALMFTNKYTLNFDQMSFEHIYKTDDGQVWYGSGTFSMKGNSLTLSFENSSERFNAQLLIEKHFSQSKSDTLVLSFIDNYYDGFGQVEIDNKLYTANFDGTIGIAKSSLNDNGEINIPHNGTRRIVDSCNDPFLKKVIIKGQIVFGRIHFESGFERILKIRSKTLIANDDHENSGKKSVRFKLIED